MTRAYLFIETGEVRCPEEGEWGLDFEGDVICAPHSTGDFHILTRHEIEINPLADILTVSQGNKGVPLCIEWKEIPIPRPKKKVKKWQWLFRTDIDEIKLTSCRYRSEKDVFDALGRHCVSILFPVMETEIEVEEE